MAVKQLAEYGNYAGHVRNGLYPGLEKGIFSVGGILCPGGQDVCANDKKIQMRKLIKQILPI